MMLAGFARLAAVFSFHAVAIIATAVSSGTNQ